MDDDSEVSESDETEIDEWIITIDTTQIQINDNELKILTSHI